MGLLHEYSAKGDVEHIKKLLDVDTPDRPDVNEKDEVLSSYYDDK
jgi:hypothetical protein